MTTLSLSTILSSAQTSHSCMLRFTLQQHICYPVEKHNWMVFADPDVLPENYCLKAHKVRKSKEVHWTPVKKADNSTHNSRKEKSTQAEKRAIAALCTFAHLKTHTLFWQHCTRWSTGLFFFIIIISWNVAKREWVPNKAFLQCQEFQKHSCMEYST